MTYNIVWEFRVPLQRIEEFEAAYGSQGEWARLFGRAAGFIGVKLLHSTDQEGRYLTIDRWVSQAAVAAFQAQFAPDYEALDERLEGIATNETRIGTFVDVGAMAEALLTQPAAVEVPVKRPRARKRKGSA